MTLQDYIQKDIERLEAMYLKELEISFEKAHENYIHNHAIETIIDIKRKELEELNKKI